MFVGEYPFWNLIGLALMSYATYKLLYGKKLSDIEQYKGNPEPMDLTLYQLFVLLPIFIVGIVLFFI